MEVWCLAVAVGRRREPNSRCFHQGVAEPCNPRMHDCAQSVYLRKIAVVSVVTLKTTREVLVLLVSMARTKELPVYQVAM